MTKRPHLIRAVDDELAVLIQNQPLTLQVTRTEHRAFLEERTHLVAERREQFVLDGRDDQIHDGPGLADDFEPSAWIGRRGGLRRRLLRRRGTGAARVRRGLSRLGPLDLPLQRPT
jgi:hypothetical protein